MNQNEKADKHEAQPSGKMIRCASKGFAAVRLRCAWMSFLSFALLLVAVFAPHTGMEDKLYILLPVMIALIMTAVVFAKLRKHRGSDGVVADYEFAKSVEQIGSFALISVAASIWSFVAYLVTWLSGSAMTAGGARWILLVALLVNSAALILVRSDWKSLVWE